MLAYVQTLLSPQKKSEKPLLRVFLRDGGRGGLYTGQYNACETEFFDKKL